VRSLEPSPFGYDVSDLAHEVTSFRRATRSDAPECVGVGKPTPLAGSCCSLTCRPSQERFRTRERQSGAPSVERVLHHEACREGAVQIPLNCIGAVAKEPVPGRDGGRENKPGNEQCYAREPGPGILACRGPRPSLAIMLARGVSRTSVVRGDTGADAELLVPDAAVSARSLFSETLPVSATPSPFLFDGQPRTRQSVWAWGKPTPLAGSCCSPGAARRSIGFALRNASAALRASSVSASTKRARKAL